MKNKKILIVCLIIIILASLITCIYILVNNKDEGTNNFKVEGIDTAEKQEVLKDDSIEGLKITNVSLLARDDVSTFKATISNDTTKEINVDKLYVVFYINDEEIKTLGLKNANLSANESTYIKATIDKDLTKVTKIKYVIEDDSKVE